MVLSDAWQDLRALRATPPGLAARDDRRATYGAALRQAEELAVATRAAGYAAKPLPSFYSLSQAGRALAAARASSAWEPRGHGLMVNTASSENVLDTNVEPRGSSQTSFAIVASAIGSPTLAGPVTVAELWAANPDLRSVPLPLSHQCPRALELPIGTQTLGGTIPGEPEQDPDTMPVGTGGMLSVAVDLPADVQTAADVEAALAAYPTLRGAFALKQGPSGAVRADPGDEVPRHHVRGAERVNVAVTCPVETTMSDLWSRQRALASIIEVDETVPATPAPSWVGFALPNLAAADAPHPLMLWWALLLGLSSLARYEPAACDGGARSRRVGTRRRSRARLGHRG